VEPGKYLHANCGTEAALDPSSPSIDPRYGLGRCHNCHDMSKPRRNALPLDHLVREDMYSPEKWEVIREKDELRRLVGRYAADDGRTLPLPAISRLVALFDKYGYGGFEASSRMRELAAVHDESSAKRKTAKPKRQPA